MSNPTRIPRVVVLAGAVALLTASAACGNDPFAFNWDDTPRTVLLYSLARPELNLVSGYAFRQHTRIRIEAPEATGTWDVALDTQDGQLVLLPPGALGVTSTARIAPLGGVTLESVTEAPDDSTAYVTNAPVPVADGTVYVIRTNRSPGPFGSSCIYHAKMEPVVIDVPGGTLTFRYVASPVCNSRDLIPPR